MLKSDFAASISAQIGVPKVKIQGFSAHAWGAMCCPIICVWVNFQHLKDVDFFQDLILSCLAVPYFDPFPCWQARFEMYFDSTRNIYSVNAFTNWFLPYTVGIYSPETTGKLCPWLSACTRTI